MKNQTEQTELAVATQEKMEVARPDPMRSFDVESVFRYAIEHQGSAETLEKLMSIRRELNAEKSKQAFDDAMSLFQAACPVIIKERGVPDKYGRIAYRFAPLEAVEIQIKPFEKLHGFSHSFPETGAEPGWVTASCRLTHCAGHHEDYRVKYPIGTKTQIMSDTQQYAAAETFCKRRALCNAYGLTISGEDIDGQTGKIKPQGPSKIQPPEQSLKPLAAELWNVLASVRGDKKDWQQANEWMWREDVLDAGADQAAPNLTAAQFAEAIRKAKAKLAV